jgi:hypothetical protein
VIFSQKQLVVTLQKQKVKSGPADFWIGEHFFRAFAIEILGAMQEGACLKKGKFFSADLLF